MVALIPALLVAALVLGPACGGSSDNAVEPTGTATQAAASPTATELPPTSEATATTQPPTATPPPQPTATHLPPPASTATRVPPPPAPTAPVTSGVTLTIVAQDTRFDRSTLDANAGETVTLVLQNRDDGIMHNIVISAPGGGTIAGTQISTGPSTTSTTFAAPSPGSYTFVCTVHPRQMSGTFIVH